MKRIIDRKLLDSYQGIECLVCSYKTSTVAHHVKTKGAGGDDVEENLMPLCHIHHAEIHQLSLTRFTEKYPMVKTFLRLFGWKYDHYSNRWYQPPK